MDELPTENQEDSFLNDSENDFLNQYSNKKNNPSTPQRIPYHPNTGKEKNASVKNNEEPEDSKQSINRGGTAMTDTETKKSEIEHLSIEKCFMGIAILASMRSNDPVNKSGVCIVDKENEILSIGYNGFPCGCNEEDYPWSDSNNDILQTKHPYMVHSFLNAILKTKVKNFSGAVLYSTEYPCNNCAKAIIQSGIKKIIYLSIKEKGKPEFSASTRMLMDANVLTKPYFADKNPVQILYTN